MNLIFLCLGSVTQDTFLCFDTEKLYVTKINISVSLKNLNNVFLPHQLLVFHRTDVIIEVYELKICQNIRGISILKVLLYLLVYVKRIKAAKRKKEARSTT